MVAGVRGKRTIGYTFFEHTLLSPGDIERARQFFDVIVAGSSWCRDLLSQYGVENACTILQGVDQTIFNPYANHKHFFDEHFVIFYWGEILSSVRARISSFAPFKFSMNGIKTRCW